MHAPPHPARTPTATRAVPSSQLTNPPRCPSQCTSSMSSSPRCARCPRTTSRTAPNTWRVASTIAPPSSNSRRFAPSYIRERGDSRFRRAMSRHSGAIRSCVNHTGPPDALKGDAPHRAVREMASQAVAAVFSEGSSSSAASISSDSSSHRPAFASTLAAPAAVPIIGDASDGAPRLNKTTGTWGGTVHRLDPPPSRAFVVPERSPSSTPDAVSDFASQDRETRETRETLAAPSPPPPSIVSPSPPSPTQARLSADTAAPFVLAGSEEQRRVDEACARGGVKLAPPADVLDAFTRACDGLNAEGLARALANTLRGAIAPGGTWQDGYKAACCVEAAAGGRCGRREIG